MSAAPIANGQRLLTLLSPPIYVHNAKFLLEVSGKKSNFFLPKATTPLNSSPFGPEGSIDPRVSTSGLDGDDGTHADSAPSAPHHFGDRCETQSRNTNL